MLIMRTFITLKSIAMTAAVAVAFAIAGSSAWAGDPCDPPRYTYKMVTVYETVRKPYDYVVKKYDHCGKPYHVTRTGWKNVRIPVVRKIKVQY